MKNLVLTFVSIVVLGVLTAPGKRENKENKMIICDYDRITSTAINCRKQ